MPYKKRIHEKVHNLPEEFLNNFDGYLVHEKIGDMYPHLQLNNDRVLRLEDVKKIELWHRNNNLQGFFLDWEHVIIPLCRVLRVPMKKRSELYSKYRESKKRKHSIEAELALYITHGLLHNLGFSDEDTAGAGEMHAVEDKILQQAGFGIVYSKDP